MPISREDFIVDLELRGYHMHSSDDYRTKDGQTRAHLTRQGVRIEVKQEDDGGTMRWKRVSSGFFRELSFVKGALTGWKAETFKSW